VSRLDANAHESFRQNGSEADTSNTITARTDEIARFLASGQSDPMFIAWPGGILERSRLAESELRSALVAEVERRAAAARPQAPVPALDLVAYTRGRVEPMVRGLFPRGEQDAVLRVLERSVVLLTPVNIADVIRDGDGARHAILAWRR
jgi:hypothetical protein